MRLFPSIVRRFTKWQNVKEATMAEAKLSSKNQIVIPLEARKALRLKSGDKLLIVPRGETLIVMRKPKNYARAIIGVAKDMYPPDYLERERESW
jgi:AbrB family looped-hinge helix DNA binding protein